MAVFDYNADGRPDIFFTNGAEMPTLAKRGDAYANRLYRNDGGMKFTDVTAAAGVSGIGYAMGAAAADYDNDGHVDLFVAGVALPESGRPISGMGVDFQDYDNDGWEDIHLTGISGETFPLFHNDLLRARRPLDPHRHRPRRFPQSEMRARVRRGRVTGGS